MATTGNTKLKTIELIETAVRRCGKLPEKLTAEQLDTCRTDAYTVIAHLANNGLQLWCIEKLTFTLLAGQGTYQNPLPGAESVEDAVFRQPTMADTTGPTIVSPATVASATVGSTLVAGINYLPSADGTLTVVLEVFNGASWKQVGTFTGDVVDGQLQWFNLDRQLTGTAVRLRETATTAIVPGTIGVAVSINDTPMQPMSRDEYAWQPQKLQASGLPCLYYFERKVVPLLNIYPTTNRDTDYLLLWWKRNIQDLTSLSAEIEVPTRWYHAIITALAATLALDLPKVDPAIIQLLESKATAAVQLAAGNEVDKGPARIVPAIGGYTA